MLAETPNRPEVMVAMNKLEALNQNEIRFGEEQVTIRIAGAEQQQSYKIINAHTNALQIFWIETNELNDCVFINADTLRIFEGGQEKSVCRASNRRRTSHNLASSSLTLAMDSGHR